MIKFIRSLQFICQPFYWIKLHPYSEPLDKEINRLLDEGILFTNIDKFTATLGHLNELWLSNGNGSFCEMNGYVPSRLTVKRAKKVLQESLIKQSLKQKIKVNHG